MGDTPTWLHEAFREGVDDQLRDLGRLWPAPYRGARRLCWLARLDQRRRPCEGRTERFHFVGRQRVKNALGALLPVVAEGMTIRLDNPDADWTPVPIAELILLAEWDPRNGGHGCEAHHRRFDSHREPRLIIPRAALPAAVEEWAADWGLEAELERRFA